jgi:NTE family protein
MPTEAPTGPVAAVLAGAGARGAYEAGMLSRLLVALDGRHQRPRIFTGTSAGAINAVLYASLAHEPAARAADRAIDLWRTIRKSDVMTLGIRSVAEFLASYAGALVGLERAKSALLDTRPLGESLRTLIDWNQIQENLDNPDVPLDTVAVVTTEYASDYIRSRVWYSSSTVSAAPPPDNRRALDYVPTTLTADHVLASASIPIAFPPVRLSDNGRTAWHMDGGVRLNAPLKPAIELGAGGLVVIASAPATFPPAGTAPGTQPPLQDAVDQVLRTVLNYQMVDDLLNLTRTNLLAQAAPTRVRSSTGRRDYRVIPCIFGGPPTNPAPSDTLDDVAGKALQSITGGVRWLRNLDLAALGGLLRSGSTSKADLMSYLLFEPQFISAAIKLGEMDVPRPVWGL